MASRAPCALLVAVLLGTALCSSPASGAQEVILSGGDPLAVNDRRLLEAIDRLRPAVPILRIHTRAPP